MEGKDALVLVGYCEADWESPFDDRRSTSGYTFMLVSGGINCSSKEQLRIALSSTEAEL